MPDFPDLSGWLRYIEGIHPKTVEMGLDRVRAVKEKMGLSPSFPVIAVAGTNGKGSTCAMLESLLHHAGYRTGCYTSPHLLRFSERIRLDRREAQDVEICSALARVEQARGETSLTYFEYTTLAAVQLFIDQRVDIAILEVGLGGRLDAVNAFDADCAVITGIDFDHMDYLGNTLGEISAEKAGIFRNGHCAVSATDLVLDPAREAGARLFLAGRDFSWENLGTSWNYHGMKRKLDVLSIPSLEGSVQLSNASVALAALDCLGIFPDEKTASAAFLDLELRGRFQKFGDVTLDVAHNPQAARNLAANLKQNPGSGKTVAIFSMLADKDIEGVIRAVSGEIDEWVIYPLDVPRGADLPRLERAFSEQGFGNPVKAASMREAWNFACALAAGNDRILVFGSFHTVADFMDLNPNGGARGHG